MAIVFQLISWLPLFYSFFSQLSECFFECTGGLLATSLNIFPSTLPVIYYGFIVLLAIPQKSCNISEYISICTFLSGQDNLMPHYPIYIILISFCSPQISLFQTSLKANNPLYPLMLPKFIFSIAFIITLPITLFLLFSLYKKEVP